MKKLLLKLFAPCPIPVLGLYPTVKTYKCYGVEIPRWCIGTEINIYKKNITTLEQKAVRQWYQKNLPEYCETITDRRSNWIGSTFGTRYYSPDTRSWNGYRLYVGDDIYVRLY